MAAPIDFYFEFASPYGYLASTRIDAIAARHGREAFWHPIMLGAAFKLTGAQPLVRTPLKGDYMMRDLPRFRTASRRALQSAAGDAGQLARREPRLHLARAGRSGEAKALAQAVLHAHWGEGRDIARPSRWSPIWPSRSASSAPALLAAVADPAIKDRLKQATEAAIERGVFGSPFVLVDGEAFWGADRLDQVERWLAAGGW